MSAAARDIAHYIWDQRYRWRRDGVPVEATPEDSWRRVARAIAAAEPLRQNEWAMRLLEILQRGEFIPGGRILAGAGTGQRVTLFNCFVMGVIGDSVPGIFRALHEGAVTLQQGGGIGYDFSTLRPHGAAARASGGMASGPVSFMHIWDSMTATLVCTGYRRGAMMATLRCDHPDIERFIAAKQTPGALTRFNLSVQVTDDFMAAVRQDADWPLVFPVAAGAPDGGELVWRSWTGTAQPLPCRIHRVIRARALWQAMVASAHGYSEPGLLFVDRINRENPLCYRERLSATNPCGEIPLPPYGACDLGSLNLCAFVRDAFTPQAQLDIARLRAVVPLAVRLLDDVIEVSRFPLPAQAEQARATRRVGLGLTGLADAFILLGLRYDSEAARELARQWMTEITHGAYRASVELAREKGGFPALDAAQHLRGAFIGRLPGDIREGIERHGLRNSHLLAIAPAGTISLLAGNVSSGIEPVYAARIERRIRDVHRGVQAVVLEDHALRRWQAQHGDGSRPPAFVTAAEISTESQLRMQAVLQPLVDNAISKTLQLPAEASVAEVARIYEHAYDMGLKGCTVFRTGSIPDAILQCGTQPDLDQCTV